MTVEQYCENSYTSVDNINPLAFTVLPSGRGVSTGDFMPTETRRITVRPSIARAVRAVAWYVNNQFSPGSVAGKWAIHETRIDGPELTLEEIEELSMMETVRLIRLAELRRKLYAPLPRRTDVVYTSGEDKGKPMRPVAPRQDIAHVVRVRPSRCYAGGDSTSGRRMQISICLGKLGKPTEKKIIEVAEDSQDRVYVLNRLERAESDARRLRGGGKRAHTLRSIVEAEVRDLSAEERAIGARITEAVSGETYRRGISRLANIFVSTPEIEAEVFGEAA